MAATGFNTIVVEWPEYVGPKYREALAAAAINPGELVDKDSTGKLILHAKAAGTSPVQKWIAVEDPYADPTSSSKAIDIDWTIGDTVSYVVAPRGSVLYMWLADGETTAIGDPLTSDGAGLLEVVTESASIHPEAIVGWATEVVAASGSDERILVEIA